MNGKRAWAVTAVVCACFFVVAAVNGQRIPPVLAVLMAEFGLDLVQGGWLMTIYGIASTIFALPAAFVLLKAGPKGALALSVGISALGGIIGAFAGDWTMLMVGRFVDGIGQGLMCVITTAIVAEWFTPEKRGIPTSVLISSFPVGIIFIMNVAAPLTNAFGWQGVWWIGIIISIVCLVLALVVIPNSRPYTESVMGQGGTETEKSSGKISMSVVLKSGSLWLVALAFVAFNLAYYGLTAYMPLLMVDNIGVPLDTANLISSLIAVTMIPGSLIAGYLLGKVKSRKIVPAVASALLAIIYYVVFFSDTTVMASALMLIAGFVAGFIPGALFTIAPDTIPNPLYIGVCMTIATFGQNLGVSIGPVLMGSIVEGAGNVWTAAALPTALVSFMGAVCCILIRNKKKNGVKQQNVEQENS